MIIATFLAVAFIASALAGVLIFIRLGIGREEREGNFSREAPNRIASATRSLAGLHVCTPERKGSSDRAEYAATRIGAGQSR
jgi:hypothetical protein